jgi:uncharacterized surface protein with fasciclin (FAS1) repeats
MNLRRRTATVAAFATALSVAALGLGAAPASAKPLGTKSLASVLLSDGNKFDHNWKDYDIVTEAVLAVLAAKPNSPVGVLTDGKTAVTAFIPRDIAFKRLVTDITGKAPKSEKATFNAVAGLGIDTVESVLLYHVVPGATITKKAALNADEAKLTTALGSKITVNVYAHKTRIKLRDADKSDRNPRIVAFNINKGNKQIAHGLDRVLRPIDLP